MQALKGLAEDEELIIVEVEEEKMVSERLSKVVWEEMKL